jgi:DNA polymerase III subunit beta
MNQIETAVEPRFELTCERDVLAEKLALVSRAVSSRTAVQILTGILLEAGDGRLDLAATDMDMSLRSSLDASVGAQGRAVVPGRLLMDVARLLAADEVSFEQRPEEGSVVITCGSAEYRVRTYAAEDFPRLPEVEDAALFEVDRQLFLETIARVSRAASRDESRPVLTGILVRFERGKLVMAATDSYRLAVKETALAGEAAVEAIVPARALAELARLSAGAGSLELGLHENHVVFVTDDVWLTTRRIDGQFPDYRQLLPETSEYELRLPRSELLDVVRRMAVMAQRNAPLRLRFSEGELTISAQTQDVGEAREALPLEFAGEPLEIGFNPDFLREGIESAEGEEFSLRLISPLRPGLIRSDSETFSYLIMPIRLAG